MAAKSAPPTPQRQRPKSPPRYPAFFRQAIIVSEPAFAAGKCAGWEASLAVNRSQRRKQGKSKRRRKGTAAESVADDLLGLIRAGQQHHVAGRLVDAEKAYRSVLARDPENADANQLLGVIAMQVGNLEIAAELIGKALRRDPDHAQAHGNLGIIHWEGGRPAEAERSYRRALELNPNNSQAHSNLGLVHWTNGRLEEAEKCYRRALDIDPGNVQAHNNLGLLLTGARRLAEAEQSLRRALELNPGFAMAHDNLGLLLLQTDRGDEGVLVFPDRHRPRSRERPILVQLGPVPASRPDRIRRSRPVSGFVAPFGPAHGGPEIRRPADRQGVEP